MDKNEKKFVEAEMLKHLKKITKRITEEAVKAGIDGPIKIVVSPYAKSGYAEVNRETVFTYLNEEEEI